MILAAFIADGLNVFKCLEVVIFVFGFCVSFFGSVWGVCKRRFVVGPRVRDGRIVFNSLTLRAPAEPWCLRM